MRYNTCILKINQPIFIKMLKNFIVTYYVDKFIKGLENLPANFHRDYRKLD